MKIFVTRAISVAGIDQIRAAGHEVVGLSPTSLATEELIAELKAHDPDAVLCLLTDHINASVFDAAPRAKIFANYAVGFDNIDLSAAAARDILVTNTPDVLTEAVAEYTVALTLALSKRIVEADRFLRDGNYIGWEPLLLLGTELHGKTLGIVGCGRIGRRVAEIMRHGFGMRIVYHDRQANTELETALDATYAADLDSLLADADVVSIHLPLTDTTRHLFGAETFAKMKRTALLINTARGPIIDEAALAAALGEDIIAGAGLDVFEEEPKVHPALLSRSDVIVTPHIASATNEARDAMSVVAAENILIALQGETPPNLVS